MEWVGAGTVVAVVLSNILFFVTKETFGTFYLPAFLALFGFVVMGVIIGYFSDGVTIKEAAIAGAISMVLTVLVWRFVFDYYPPVGQLVLAPVLGFVLGLVGAWVGEEMQGSLEENDKAMSLVVFPGWIIAGTVFAYISNNLLVFLTAPLFDYSDLGVRVSYSISFLIASFVIGYKSPGTTVVESVIAGVFAVMLSNFVLFVNLYMRGSSFAPQFELVATDVLYAVLFSFVGAYVGEKFNILKEFLLNKIFIDKNKAVFWWKTVEK